MTKIERLDFPFFFSEEGGLECKYVLPNRLQKILHVNWNENTRQAEVTFISWEPDPTLQLKLGVSTMTKG